MIKISLTTRFAEAPQPGIVPDNWSVTESALMTATAVASRVNGHLAGRFFVEECFEVLRFRFLKQREDGTTLFKFAFVVSFLGERHKQTREIESSLEMPNTRYGDTVNYRTVNDLCEVITAFICRELQVILQARRQSVDDYLARLSQRTLTHA